MISINDIKNANLSKSRMGGYKIEEVDSLLNDICEAMAQSEQQKGELTRKLKILGDRVEQYRAEEQTIKSALYDIQRRKIESERSSDEQARQILEKAQAAANDVKQRLQAEIQAANNEAKQIKLQAMAEAQKIIKDAQRQKAEILVEVQNAKADCINIQNKMVDFRNDLIEKYKEHLRIISMLPSKETVQKNAAELDRLFPTKKLEEPELNRNNPPKKTNEHEDIEAMIQRTLEFDVGVVKKAANNMERGSTENGYTIDDSFLSEISSNDIENISSTQPIRLQNNGESNNETERSAQPHFKRNKIKFKSRTVTPSGDNDTKKSNEDEIKIVDVDLAPEQMIGKSRFTVDSNK